MSHDTKTILVHRTKSTKGKAKEQGLSPQKSQLNTEEAFERNGQTLDGDSNVFDSTKFIEATSDATSSNEQTSREIGTDYTFKRDIVWSNAIGFLILHLAGLAGLAVMGLGYAKWMTFFYFLFLTFLSGMGITMGAHRYFTHRSYKAKTWVKVTLMLLHTMAGQNCLYVWVRDHRQHHKYSDTDADPHNANRGFFFSHVGWLMSKKHPKVIEYGKKIDMSDMEADPWIMFQKKYYKTLYTIFTLVLPTAIPCIFWNETGVVSLFATYFARYILQLNFTWSVNSVAHIFGNKPYDQNILPVESVFVSMVAGGEGWHNYHHTFPWDYRTAELGMPFNVTTDFIDLLAKYGQIYDRKTVSEAVLRGRIARTGDGSHAHSVEHATDHNENYIDDSAIRKFIIEKNHINSALSANHELSNIDDLNNNQNTIKSKLNATHVSRDKAALNI